MKQLYLCEKPSQAKDIAKVLGATSRQDGYFTGHEVYVTWCYGHLLEMAAPEDYDPTYKTWSLEALPIVPKIWQWQVKPKVKKQVNIITGLFKQVDEIVIATDADREGEAIARELMDRGHWHGPIFRLWLSALDDTSIQKALGNLLPGRQTESLYQAATARAKADWLVGMNLSRLYTLSARQAGYSGVLSVGRVQTPTLKLVVDRDRVIEAFKPVPYYEVIAQFHTQTSIVQSFIGKWQVPEQLSDAAGRCLNEASARSAATRCLKQSGTVVHVSTKRVKETPPLPFSLSSLQQEASKRLGLGAQQVLDTAQALYETHKLTTYPRTDCDYLPKSMLESVDTVVYALKADEILRPYVDQADRTLCSRAFNDQKVTAHHAIIPTGVKPTQALSPVEQQLFHLISLRYLAQFYLKFEFDQTEIIVHVGEDRFISSGKQVIEPGWTVLHRQNSQKQNDAETILPKLTENDRVTVTECAVDQKQTQPPSRYTEGTLIQAMKHISQFVDHPELKKRLKATSGLGTEATRAGILEILLKRGFLKKQKKQLISTESGRALIDLLPLPVKDPATTAVWEQALEDIVQGEADSTQLIQQQTQLITRLIEDVRQHPVQSVFKPPSSNQIKTYACPSCQHPLVRRTGKNGFFWGCKNYPECTVTLPDEKGKPGKIRDKPQSTGESCPECQEGVRVKRTIRKGQRRGQTFFGCSRYPDCHYSEFA